MQKDYFPLKTVIGDDVSLLMVLPGLAVFAFVYYIRKQISYGEHIQLRIDKARADKSLAGLHHLKSRY